MTPMFHDIFMESLNHMACMRSCFNRVHLFMTFWTVTCQAPLSMGFSRQEHWSGLSLPSPGHIPNPTRSNLCLLHCISCIASPALQVDSLPLSHRCINYISLKLEGEKKKNKFLKICTLYTYKLYL